jgi:hypothetical protein
MSGLGLSSFHLPGEIIYQSHSSCSIIQAKSEVTSFLWARRQPACTASTKSLFPKVWQAGCLRSQGKTLFPGQNRGVSFPYCEEVCPGALTIRRAATVSVLVDALLDSEVPSTQSSSSF